ncbi:hypothetical protein CMUS01_09306 [Colletotrichum musicola]|uniref:Uncharacterized protein n=1 Tax=Colletotrichum musicola TaxID=2175873 RepID=A0A8H6K8K0_9PEZI|nr:hypothetical protein CMUS01_09306 [Colletotrichum musicola]
MSSHSSSHSYPATQSRQAGSQERDSWDEEKDIKIQFNKSNARRLADTVNKSRPVAYAADQIDLPLTSPDPPKTAVPCALKHQYGAAALDAPHPHPHPHSLGLFAYHQLYHTVPLPTITLAWFCYARLDVPFREVFALTSPTLSSPRTRTSAGDSIGRRLTAEAVSASGNARQVRMVAASEAVLQVGEARMLC